MADEQDPQQESDDITRRDFVRMSIAAGIAVGAGSTAADAQGQVVETSVDVKTPDGTCDAVFVHPATGSYPAVLIWPDAFGRRPSMHGFARRIAAEGYAVLVPNPFYRTAKAPVFPDPSKFDFGNQADRAKLGTFTGPLNEPGAAERDAIAYIAFLDAQKQVDRSKKVGTQGYCMGGPLIMRTAATVPDRVGAAASFHGGGLVTPQPTSPHLLIPKMKAQGVRLIIAEPNRERQNPEFVASNTGARVLLLPIMPGTEHGADYIGLIDYNVGQVADALKAP